MDFGAILDDSFIYIREGLIGQWLKWIQLIILEILPSIPIIAWIILFVGSLMISGTPDVIMFFAGFAISVIITLLLGAFFQGYLLKILRGDKHLPEVSHLGELFIDGLKLVVVQIIYLLPVILLIIIALVPMISTFLSSGAFSQNFTTMSESQTERWLSSHPELLTAAGLMVILLLIAVLLAIIVAIFSFIGVVRFARTESIGEAFNFSAILAHIGRIGWVNYIIALLIITVIGFIFGMILNIFSLIPYVGDVLGLIVMVVLYVPFLLFSARYSALVYDEGVEKPVPVVEGIVR